MNALYNTKVDFSLLFFFSSFFPFLIYIVLCLASISLITVQVFLRTFKSILSNVRFQDCIKVVFSFLVVMNKIWILLILGKSSDDEEPVEPIDLGQCPVPCPEASTVPAREICSWLMISSLAWELLLAD